MIPLNLAAWAIRHGIPAAALHDLARELAMDDPAPLPPPAAPPRADEAYVSSRVRIAAATEGWHLWRNNVGAFEDKTGRWIRYGLANDSAKMNDRLKSSDLVGWRQVTVTPNMVGKTIAQFVSLETKAPDWTYSGSAREEAQARWIGLVVSCGGYAKFTVGTL